MKMARGRCSIESCGRAVEAKGMCSKHYSRVRRHGNPHTINKPGGHPPPERRLWHNVDKEGPLILETRCWQFNGHTNQWGYSQIMIDKKNVYVHRLAYTIYKGAIPNDRIVMHRCDNTRCVNPEHLTLGTYLDNSRDMVKKCRGHWQKNRGKTA